MALQSLGSTPAPRAYGWSPCAPIIAIEEWVGGGTGHSDLAEATPLKVEFALLSPGCCVDAGCSRKIA